MAPRVPIEDPECVERELKKHQDHPQLQKTQLTQYNCYFQDMDPHETKQPSFICEPFQRYFWECVHASKVKEEPPITHRWESPTP